MLLFEAVPEYLWVLRRCQFYFWAKLAFSIANGQVKKNLAVSLPFSDELVVCTFKLQVGPKNRTVIHRKGEGVLDRSRRVEKSSPRCRHLPSPLSGRKTENSRKNTFQTGYFLDTVGMALQLFASNQHLVSATELNCYDMLGLIVVSSVERFARHTR